MKHHSLDPKDTKRLGFPWCDRSEVPHLGEVSAAAHHPDNQSPCLFFGFSYSLELSCALRKGMRIITPGE